MAEKVIRNNQSIIPFFGERLSFIRGLDPLGLQNTSDATFSMLLPGLNNVTGRIRYYSFYCWLLEEYSKTSGSTNPADQQRFIRRSEYIIALASSYFSGDSSNIPGSLYASRQIQNDPEVIHDLELGTFKDDGSTAETYWKFPMGAFGQYYFGSLNDIGVVSRRDNDSGLYVRTNSQEDHFVRGESLANAFDESLSDASKQLFLNCVESGHITEKQLEGLLPDFNLMLVPADSREQELLIEVLVQKDFPLHIEEDPTIYRSTTIHYLLEYLKTTDDKIFDRTFIYNCYKIKGRVNNENQPTIMGWYYYQFNEYWHFSNTAIFNGALTYLEDTSGPNWISVRSFLDQATQSVIVKFKETKYITSENETLAKLLSKLSSDEDHFLTECSQSQSISRMCNGFLLFFSQYQNQLNDLINLKEYAEQHDLSKDGEGSGYFINEFKAKMEMPIKDFVFEYLYKHIIYRHQYVALRKIRNGMQSTQKFIIEDHHIRYLGNFEPGFTGPRLGNLINFLKDLGIIGSDFSLSPKGVTLLNSMADGIN